MTAALQRKSTLRTRVAPQQRAKQRPQQRREKKSHLRLSISEQQSSTEQITTEKPEAAIPLERLREAAEKEESRQIPYQDRLIQAFGGDSQSVEAIWSPEISTALELVGADAATVDGRVVLKGPDVSFETVAHETAHALQTQNTETCDLVPADSAAEAEAEAAARVAEEGGRVDRLTETLPANAVALRRPPESQQQADSERGDRQDFQSASNEETEEEVSSTETESQADRGENESESVAGDSVNDSAGDNTGDSVLGENTANAVDMEPSPTFELPPEPEIEVDEEAKARVEQAQSAIAAATTADAYLEAVTTAPPSVKAQFEPTVEDDMARLADGEETDFQESVPDFEAQMGAGEDIPESEAVVSPNATAEALEADTPAPVEPADEGRLPEPEAYGGNERVVNFLRQFFGIGDSASVGRSLSKVKTTDDVDTDPGIPPPVSLEGEADPQRVEDQVQASSDQSRKKRDEATNEVMNGRGPEAVQAQPLEEAMPVPELIQANFEGTTQVAEGAAEFREKTLDPEVVALFDAEHSLVMEASLSNAQTDLSAASKTRDDDRQTEVSDAEIENTRLNDEADGDQRKQVIDSRNLIQDARQTAVDGQAQAVTDLETDAGVEQRLAKGKIDTRVVSENSRITGRYDKAESDSKDEVKKGEGKAEAKKTESENKAENNSWWDQAFDWVAKQFDKLKDAINAVFDAVRSAIKGFIDDAKEFAEGVIDAAATFVKGAIRVFGEVVKAGVNTLLADTFPGLAKTLNDGVDTFVETAEKAVDSVAEGLKAGINALLDLLGKALDAILALYQAAINAVMALARAALTGDWSEVARMILEPILKALGIDPKEFYAFFGQVAQVIGTIIDAPGVFMKNLMDGVMGGFRLFGTNLISHLQKGIISWLTGALGSGIKLPGEWNLFGVLDLIRQVLGLTVDMMRRVAVRILGKEAVEKIEFFIDFAVVLITGGWEAFYDKISKSFTNIQDMILQQIKSFLLEKIIIAAVTWLIGLFNPVGALVKIVMTIWNLVMFLKNQLMRIIQVVRTVVQLIMDIANRVLEPVITGVEGVLASMLPIVIDLLARLLGLGNVAAKVREVISSVRKTIEDAIVGLIKNVIGRFTGGKKGKGKGAKSDKDSENKNTKPVGEIMKPITVTGGGESHTLFIKVTGKDAKPMMRSQEGKVEDWLSALKNKDTVKGFLEKNKSTSDSDEVFNELQPLVDKAIEEEKQLENKADGVVEKKSKSPKAKKPNSSSVSNNKGGADKAVAQEGAQLGEAMKQIFEKLGFPDKKDLGEKFKLDIKKMRLDVASNFTQFILPKMAQSINDYGNKNWPEVRNILPTDPASLTGPWQKPASGDGVLRTRTEGEFDKAVYIKAVEQAKKFSDADKIKTMLEMDEKEKSFKFISLYMSEKLNRAGPAKKLLSHILGNKSNSWDAVLNDMKEDFNSAVTAFSKSDEKKQPDYSIKNEIKGTSIEGIFENIKGLKNNTYTYYQVQESADKKPVGEGKEKPLIWFINRRGNQSSRASQNRTWVADKIRDAKKGKHEWIPASNAAAAIQATIDQLEETGEARNGVEVVNFAAFQLNVRTSTSDLIFSPDWAGNGQNAGYYSRGHYDRVVNGKAKNLSSEYPGVTEPEDKVIGKNVKTLQAHAGGLRGFQIEGDTVSKAPLEHRSSVWHAELRKELAEVISSDGFLKLKTIESIGDSILGFFKETILNESSNISSLGPENKTFNLYYLTHDGGGPKSLNEVMEIAESNYESAYKDLEKKISESIK